MALLTVILLHTIVGNLEDFVQTLSRDHRTLGCFQSLLNRYNVKDLKKEVDASIDFLLTVVKGHFLACACKILGITSLKSRVALPPHIYKATIDQQRAYITSHQLQNK